MSSATNVLTTLDSIIYNFNIFTGLFVFIFGIIGNSLNIIVFMSLKTFRKNPCAFCLLILSISDSGLLLFSTIPNILNSMYRNSGTVNFIFTCKISLTLGQSFALISHCIICLAAIDQCFSTSMNERFKGMSINFIRRLIFGFISVCILYGIPFLIYYNVQKLPETNTTTCHLIDNNGVFSKYLAYVGFPIVGGLLPIFIMSLFALIALRNVRQMTRRRIHIIRLRLEQQLTKMVLIKIFSVCFSLIPFLINYTARYIILSYNNDPFIQKQFLLVNYIFMFLLFINYADNFYIFFASSTRFRRQLKFVLFNIYLKQWQTKRNINRTHPRPHEHFALSIISSYQHHQ